ncbi:hypothetical protein [Streptomyces lunaelactis]|uniref:hypothetical protein n=1 Tax=Streptomyces lunaelactis TaxID=1535768 RepID=UPI0015851561|nr:hypothetical protein [Streptomyces lunaelactis]NUK05788.1 hypothetical protein [Streptomyces lunaelactis]NUK20289.1 hypothetical protein [Streptomyces lunaelactis]
MNQKMSELLHEFPVTDLKDEDIPPMFLEAMREGWSYTPNGARVLTGLIPDVASPYFDVLQEETLINGRGMIDYDLPPTGPERTGSLLKRCLSYAFGVLDEASKAFGDQEFRAYVSLSLSGSNDDTMTANVTFCTTNPSIEPYVRDLESVQNEAIVELSLEDRNVWN